MKSSIKNIVLLTVFAFLFSHFSTGQTKQGNHWYFGWNAAVDFNSGAPKALSNSAMKAYGGCTSVSDANGNLLFYTNGSVVYHKNHDTMLNGTDLMTDWGYYGNWGQSVIAVQRPEVPHFYYIFTVYRKNNTGSGNYPESVRYNTVNMQEQKGLGAITKRNRILEKGTFESKLTAVTHRNGKDVWVIAKEEGTKNFHAFLVTKFGVSFNSVVSAVGVTNTTQYWWNTGSLKASADGKYIASVRPRTWGVIDSVGCDLYKFDDSTGKLTSFTEIRLPQNSTGYWYGRAGIEFSPDGTKMYISDQVWNSNYKLYQFELNDNYTAQQVQDSRILAADVTSAAYAYWGGQMQLAPDGKIYVSRYYKSYLGVINAPNQKGEGCCYDENGVTLSSYSMNGLPNIPSSWYKNEVFTWESDCFGDSIPFRIYNEACLDSVHWMFGDTASGSENFSNELRPKHYYSSSGRFDVTAVTFRKGIGDSATLQIEVYPFPVPKIGLNDPEQCFNDHEFRFIDSSTINFTDITYYNWDLGDSNTVIYNKQSFTHKYKDTGTYDVRLIIASEYGCQDTITRSVTVHPNPVAKMHLTDTISCLDGNVFDLPDSSSIIKGSYSNSWLFNRNDSLLTYFDSINAPGDTFYSFAASDTFKLTYYAVSDKGCIDDTSTIVRILPSPVSDFEINDSLQCLGLNYFTFTNKSTIPNDTLTYLWKFGDGDSAMTENATHIYKSFDTFEVSLTTTSSLGCSNTKVKKVYVRPDPYAEIVITDSIQCLNTNSFTFTSNSTIDYDSLMLSWNYGDGSAVNNTQGHPTHIYTYYDSFDVKLIVTTNFGCQDSTVREIIVHPNPVADFSINDTLQCLAQNSYIFTNNSKIDYGTLKYLWDLGDNNTTKNSGPVTHKYKTEGLYSIELFATSNHGCTDSITRVAEVAPMPSVDFKINDHTQCFNGNYFDFTNNSTIVSGSLNYTWHYGDGSSDNSIDSNHTYATDDTFSVKLIAESNHACIDSLSKTLYVFPSPVASYYMNDSVQCFNEHDVSFTNNSQINSGSMSYIWSFGDGNLGVSTNEKHAYTYDDTFNVRLIALSKLGCADSVSKDLFIFPSPMASFEIPDSQQCLTGNLFNYSNLSSISSGTFSNYWSFDDSSFTNQKTPSHSYQNDDTFNVKLLITSALGCQDSIYQKAYVFPMPHPKFSINDTSQCFDRNNFIFYNKTTINSGTLKHFWSFGDGTTSTLTTPSHSYTTPDTFNVKLVSTSLLGCTDSVEKVTTIHVQPMPVASFSTVDSAQCLSGNLFDYRNSSKITKGSMTYEWIFGDGDSSFTRNTTHTFPNHDTFLVKMLAISNWGCIDSALAYTIVYPQPQPDFVIDSAAQCLSGNKFNFSNTSQIVHGSIQAYQWDLGDGNSNNSFNTSNIYTNHDTFYVKLSATSALGCLDSTIKHVAVHPMPSVDFYAEDDDQCLEGNLFTFHDTSSIATGSNSLYNWEFSDNTTSSGSTTTHTFGSYDTFDIKLLVTSALNCVDSNSKQVYVRPMPRSKFSIDDNEQCLSLNEFTFTDLSDIDYGTIDKFRWNFDDQNTSTLQNPKHTYTYQDSFYVKLKVISNYNCKTTDSLKLIVRPNPIASFDIDDDKQCLTGNNFNFTSTSTIDYSSMSYAWDYGDGVTGTGLTSNHSYWSDTTSTVKLVVTSEYDCKDSTNKTIVVHPMPVANFEHSGLCIHENIDFTDLSTINAPDLVNQWKWDFGTATSTLQNPSHIYNTSGTKTVVLTAISNNNCEDVKSIDIYINDQVLTPTLTRVTVIDNIETEEGYIHLEWEEMNIGVPKAYSIERSLDGVNYSEIGVVDKNTFEYEDWDVDVDNKSYYYKVFVTDECDYISPDGITNSGKSILLGIDDQGEYPHLYWTLYEGWPSGISHQNINIYENGYYTYQTISSATPFDTSFTDDFSKLNVDQYCYQINAFSNNNVNSNSNIICVPTTFYIYAPNAFSPNGDALNPTFKAVGKNILEFEMAIFNRWGEQVFSSNDIHMGWDGTHNGNACPAGVYTYVLRAKGTQYQHKRMTGSITLIR